MTTLVEEQPYAAAVDSNAISHTCSKCFACNFLNLESVKLSRCTGCHVVCYCSLKCQKADWKDHKAECKLLFYASFVPSMDARLVMRMMEKSRKQPDFKAFNGRTYDSLKHNSAMRRQNVNCMTEARTIYAEISRFMGSKAPDFETVFLAISKMAMNAFPIHDSTWTYNHRGLGVYLGLSVLDHSCRPDAYVINQGQKMMLRTTNKDLVYSDKLTISYYDGFFFLDTEVRRAKLYNSYFFFCKCEDCEDIESNKKRISGRPLCCPTSWFNIAERICNKCQQEVSSELAAKTEDAMKRLQSAITVYAKGQHDGSDLSALVPEWIQLYESCKEVLSDESTLLFTVANMIYTSSPHTDVRVAGEYTDICLPHVRKRPHCVFSAVLLSRRQQFYEMAQKSLQETRQALDEALDSVQVVFGPDHDLTQFLHQKKMFFDFVALNTH